MVVAEQLVGQLLLLQLQVGHSRTRGLKMPGWQPSIKWLMWLLGVITPPLYSRLLPRSRFGVAVVLTWMGQWGP